MERTYLLFIGCGGLGSDVVSRILKMLSDYMGCDISSQPVFEPLKTTFCYAPEIQGNRSSCHIYGGMEFSNTSLGSSIYESGGNYVLEDCLWNALCRRLTLTETVETRVHSVGNGSVTLHDANGVLQESGLLRGTDYVPSVLLGSATLADDFARSAEMMYCAGGFHDYGALDTCGNVLDSSTEGIGGFHSHVDSLRDVRHQNVFLRERGKSLTQFAGAGNRDGRRAKRNARREKVIVPKLKRYRNGYNHCEMIGLRDY